MTERAQKLPDNDLNLLRHLSTVATRGKGWQRRGVRGWVFTDELTPTFPLCQDPLRRFARDQLVERDDVRDVVRTVPILMHRITQGGEDLLAELEDRAPRDIPQAAAEPSETDRESILMTQDAWLALRVLIEHPNDGSYLPKPVITAASGRPFWPEDQDHLLSRGLVTRFRPAGARTNTPFEYRATELGRRARAADTKTSKTRAMIHVPGIGFPEPQPRSGPERSNRGTVSGG